MTLRQSKAVVMSIVRERGLARHKAMLEAASKFIADLPSLSPMQVSQCATEYYTDFVHTSNEENGGEGNDTQAV
jgi:hypothetical protein